MEVLNRSKAYSENIFNNCYEDEGVLAENSTQHEAEKGCVDEGLLRVKGISEIDERESMEDMVTEEGVTVPHCEENLIGNHKENGRKKKGRKRKYEDQSRSDRKRRCQGNMDYVSSRGKKVYRKEFIGYECTHTCSKKCSEKISVIERKKIFDEFWSLQNYDSQTTFVSSLVTETPVKRKYTKNKDKGKTYTREYSLNNVVVYRDMFVQTLWISTKRVNTALIKIRNLDIKDKRGIRGGHNKTSEEYVNSIINFINKIPKYVSHYRRENTTKLFLPTDLTIAKLYNQYEQDVQNPVKLSVFKKVFYDNFDLTRKKLKKDICLTCDTLHQEIKNENNDKKKKLMLQEKLNLHWLKAEEARNLLKEDINRSKIQPQLEVLTYDLEKTLPLPRLPTNIIFYKRQLWLYNCGIHTGKKNEGHCFLWLEGIAGRGAQEVGSCIKNASHSFRC